MRGTVGQNDWRVQPDNTLQVVNPKTPQRKVPVGDIDTLITSDGRYILERRRILYGLRSSSEAQYTIQDIINGHQYPVHLSADAAEEPHLQLALFSPRARPAPGGYPLAVVRGGDVLLLPSATGTTAAVRLTRTGTDDRTVLNGVANWWYRENRFGSAQAMWFSPSGGHLMFVTFNDSSLDVVETLTYPRGGAIVRRRMPYPKWSGAMTEISISICDVDTTVSTSKPSITQLKLGKDSRQSFYLTEARWVGDRMVSVSTTSRDLTLGRVWLCTAPGWNCTEAYAAGAGRRVSELHPLFAADRSRFVVQLEDGAATGTELLEVAPAGGRVRHSTGTHRVSQLLYWDSDRHWIYYTGVSNSAGRSESHLYRRPDSGAARPAAAACLSCGGEALAGRHCHTVRAVFPPAGDGGAAVALECSRGPGRSLLLVDRPLSRALAVLDPGEELAERTRGLAAPQLITERVTLGAETVLLEVMMPKLWDEKKGGSYLFPFVLDIQDDVLELDWSLQFATLMVSKWDLVFVRIKCTAQLARRSFFDNQKRTEHIFSHLLEQYPFLDPARTAVLGTGFGGHTALVAMADSPRVDCGAAIWPVVELQLYDAYHAERYGDSTNILDAVERLRDHALFLVYGTADPLFVHGELLSRRLVELGVLFYQQVYSDEDVYFRSVKSHLLKSLEDFLIPKCFPQLIAKEDEDG
ncbi:venom dipeptidyl peptidase 4-like isoform X2 [Amphibalanus amphitrite]|uniref:venom dipeptidyl peptidase 4-like isoform X2 n=1 Tax=Amphibalanus amphitrite TaxID=1232801 RepID=UPI001C90A374|nr:venom dipeptidyl peptidase 4-like isoform X2 [Amphibalanus amphitrite]